MPTRCHFFSDVTRDWNVTKHLALLTALKTLRVHWGLLFRHNLLNFLDFDFIDFASLPPNMEELEITGLWSSEVYKILENGPASTRSWLQTHVPSPPIQFRNLTLIMYYHDLKPSKNWFTTAREAGAAMGFQFEVLTTDWKPALTTEAWSKTAFLRKNSVRLLEQRQHTEVVD
jgi:hypothetical protein